MVIGANLVSYDLLVVLTHFKGHAMEGFGGSAKNIGIGRATGKEDKKWIHHKANVGLRRYPFRR